MYQQANQIPNGQAVKIEVQITAPNGDVTRLVCDAFDSIDIEKHNEPEFFSPFDGYRYGHRPTETARLVFSIERPRAWTVYFPQPPEQPAIDDGEVVEEG